MKTYPATRLDGSIQYFDVANTWHSIDSIQKILKSIEGVNSINFGFGVERLTFQYYGVTCAVYDPNDEQDGATYRISPKAIPESNLDLSAIHAVFARHKGILSQLWDDFHAKK